MQPQLDIRLGALAPPPPLSIGHQAGFQRRRRFELGEDRFQRPQPRRPWKSVTVDRISEVASEGLGLVVGKVEVHHFVDRVAR